jgi:hypothetical protein
MTPKQLRTILDELEISRGGFGLLLGATRRSGENWTDDSTTEVPGPVATVAWLLKERPELLQLLIRRKGK